MTTTGDAGEFSFDNVTSGRYELWVARVGFVTASYGERSPGAGRPGIPIVVGEKIRSDNLLVRIPRGGAISGTILDEFGDPAMGASVTVLRYRTVNGRRTLVSSGGGEVDDRGFYRVFSLPPGDYLIQVRGYQGIARAEATSMGARDGYQAAPVQLFRQDQASGYQFGSFAGLFYPGVSSLAEATSVKLGVGEEKVNIGFRLHKVGVSRVSGVVLQPDGSPMPRADVRIVQLGPDGEEEGVTSLNYTSPVNLDGEFI